MPQDNNIKNKLQQLENQRPPDLSDMDKHWQKMQGMLKSGGSASGKTIFGKYYFGIITAVVVIGAGLLLWFYFANKNNKDAAVSKDNHHQSITTESNANNAASIINTSNDTPRTGKNILSVRRKNTLRNDIGTPAITPPKEPVVASVIPDRKALLIQLLDSLSKDSNEFTIDNRRDTVLVGMEGSILSVPTNSLGGSNEIEISLKEFYKLSDIITNKLSTTSDTDQLVTGGMIEVTAMQHGKPVSLAPGKTIRWYLSDTSAQVQQMQLFNGKKQKSSVNWIPQNKFFSRIATVTEVRVLNIQDEPYKKSESPAESIGYFMISDSSKISKDSLRSLLTEKFSYYDKIHVKGKLKNNFFNRFFHPNSVRLYPDGGTVGLGDSTWMEKSKADKYGLKATATRTVTEQQWSIQGSGSSLDYFVNRAGGDSLNRKLSGDSLAMQIKSRYSVDINTLGWINCDHFLNDSREKVFYTADLRDSAINYYTVLVFENEKSIMLGEMEGNKVGFPNLPIGEPVKLISIGINEKGEPIFAMKRAIVSKEELAGLQFENTSATAIKSSLSLMDK